MRTANAFEDTSIFMSQLAWVDSFGQKWRAEYYNGLWKVFKICSGVDLFFRTVAGSMHLTPKQVHIKAQQ